MPLIPPIPLPDEDTLALKLSLSLPPYTFPDDTFNESPGLGYLAIFPPLLVLQLLKWTTSLSGRKVLPQFGHGSKAFSL